MTGKIKTGISGKIGKRTYWGIAVLASKHTK